MSEVYEVTRVLPKCYNPSVRCSNTQQGNTMLGSVKSVGIVGNGVVGGATARTYLEFADVRVHDRDPLRSTHSLAEVLGCDVVFVCLPTPQKAGSLECDLSAVEQFCADLTRFGSGLVTVNLVLRSTVPIGTTRRLRDKYGLTNLVHSPEFLTARCANTDAMTPSRNIIGLTETPSANNIYGPNGTKLLHLYRDRFPAVPVLLMTSDESEAVKLFLNSFFAVKVSLFNEFRALADALHLDWDAVLNGVLSDGRIAHSHTKVPGPDGRRGWGGACLGKDIANLIECGIKVGVGCHVAVAALDRNRNIDRRDRGTSRSSGNFQRIDPAEQDGDE